MGLKKLTQEKQRFFIPITSQSEEKFFDTSDIPEIIKKIAQEIKNHQGRALLIGGAVRDKVMKLAPKDYDLEIYGLLPDKLRNILRQFGEINQVGMQFGVIKLYSHGLDIDIAIPRKDSRISKGHRGFLAEGDPFMSFKEAARRRDLTINSMALDVLTGELIDSFNGLEDIKNKILRATDKEKFKEDPLRVLRVMQFASRFQFQVEPETIEVCKEVVEDLKELPSSRITEEWKKLLIKGEKPSLGMRVGKEIGVFEVLHPQIQALIGLSQDEKWHKEGDVFEHTLKVLDEASLISKRNNLSETKKLILMLGALCHDFGKALATEEVNGQIISHQHDVLGEKVARDFLKRLEFGEEINEKVVKLVRYHMNPAFLWENNKKKINSEAALKRLAEKIKPATMEELIKLYEADQKGREITDEKKEDITKSVNWLYQETNKFKIRINKPEPLIKGKHLIKYLHYQPGPIFGKILKEVYEGQLDGEIKTKYQALERAKTIKRVLNYQNSWEEAFINK
jgi:tRNA nucleotidyltransferase (CCA-adding enzyme)